MNTQYKTKPRIVEAYQFTTESQYDDWPIWLKNAYDNPPYSGNSVYNLDWCWELSDNVCNTSTIYRGDWIVYFEGIMAIYSPQEFELNFEIT